MKVKKIWIAEHPTQAGNKLVSFIEPAILYDTVYSELQGEEDAYVKYKEFVLLEVDS